MNVAQSWDHCDDDIREFVDAVVGVFRSGLGDNLVGVYLHGSLAMGSYHRPKSDVDILAVVRAGLDDESARSVGLMLAQVARTRPTTGNLECSVITSNPAAQVPDPMPFEIRYQTSWHEDLLAGNIGNRQNWVDPDLPAHITTVTQRGVCLFGEPIAAVFAVIPWPRFMASVRDDFDWIVTDGHILETPVYGVLNICRVLRLLQDPERVVRSKAEGGEWAPVHLPERYRPVVDAALDAYRSSDPVTEADRRTAGRRWDREALLALAEYGRGVAQDFDRGANPER